MQASETRLRGYYIIHKVKSRPEMSKIYLFFLIPTTHK